MIVVAVAVVVIEKKVKTFTSVPLLSQITFWIATALFTSTRLNCSDTRSSRNWCSWYEELLTRRFVVILEQRFIGALTQPSQTPFDIARYSMRDETTTQIIYRDRIQVHETNLTAEGSPINRTRSARIFINNWTRKEKWTVVIACSLISCTWVVYIN